MIGWCSSGYCRRLSGTTPYYFFPKDTALTAILEDDQGNEANISIDYVTEERRLKFPDAILTAEFSDEEIGVSSNRFARCVEILGDKDGDPFGWLFSDNYFDLLPGRIKKIRVVDGPDRGRITIRPHYANRSAVVNYHKK